MHSSTESTRGAGRRRTGWRILLLLIALTVAAYGAAIAWLIREETRLVFQAGSPLSAARPPFPYEQVNLRRPDGARQFAWVMRHGEDSDDLAWILFLHGNAATIASRPNISRYDRLRELGLNIFAPEYRGFAGLDGVPSEPALYVDARAAYDYLRSHERVPPDRIVIYGWSLGSAVAVDLASRVEEAAVILEGAPASLIAIGQQQYPFFPVRLLMRNPFDSILKIGLVRAPILFIHSPEDTVIPIAEARRLYEAVRSPRKFVEVRGGHIHASEVDQAVFYGAIREFLAEHRLINRPAEHSAR